MVEIKVRAADSALAMEEIQKRLGNDALIVSTERKDGQIEIVATDEEVVKKNDTPEPLILNDSYRRDSFAPIYDQEFNKVTNASLNIAPEELVNQLSNRLSEISSDLLDIKSLIDTSDFASNSELSSTDMLRIIGFKSNNFERLGIQKDNKLEVSVKKLAKNFVNGRCAHFEKSQVFIIAGKPNSGKTTFANKFLSFMKAKNDTVDYLVFNDQSTRKFFKALKGLNADNSNDDGQRSTNLIIDAAIDDSDLDVFLGKILKEDHTLKISIIRTLQAGNSYEKMLKELNYTPQERQYIAFTKLDMCDISMQEISAMIEVSQKCMFLSGVDKVQDGLYFAKLDQIETHILNKVKEEIA